jgi:hypothetical protein
VTNVPQAWKLFSVPLVEVLGDVDQMEARFSLCWRYVQHMCMVCAKRTIGSEIILDAPDCTLCVMGQVEAHFGLFGDSVNLDAR